MKLQGLSCYQKYVKNTSLKLARDIRTQINLYYIYAKFEKSLEIQRLRTHLQLQRNYCRAACYILDFDKYSMYVLTMIIYKDSSCTD